jgi:hypothetical protein
MSYHEENGEVVLTMSKKDYESLIYRLGMYAGQLLVRGGGDFRLNMEEEFGLLNRLNSGNPHYTPYQVEEKKS